MDQHVENRFDGTGIGLSLTRELVELMGGEISLETEVGKGSRFVIDLPLLATENLPAISSFAASDHGTDARDEELKGDEGQPLMLIVDDHQEIRSFVKTQFEGDFKVIEAGNGQVGLEMAISELPDIIISDLMMPVLDGIEMCQKLKTDHRTNHIPIVMLTALATVESRIEGLQTGADDYLNKPFNPNELSARVENLVEQRRKLRARFLAQFETNEEEQDDFPQMSASEQAFFSKVEAYVIAYMTDPSLSVERLAEEMAMSRVQLFRKLKAVAGQSPSEIIRMFRLRKAADLLKEGSSNVSEVMFEAGFDNPSYFAKVFRKQYGCSPSEFKGK